MTGMEPTGPDLAAKNRRLFAAKQHWPEGIVETCEKLGAAHPDWYIDWARPGSPTYPAPGYYGARWSRERSEPMVYGATPDELEAAIESHPWGKSLGEYRPIIWPARD